MALAQVTEIVAMFGLGTVFARYRLKWILATGLGFALLRYVLLAQNTPVTVLVGVTLHGFAYTLFFVAVPIYLNERIEARWRGRAQALLSLMNQGLGGVVGFLGTGYWLSLCRAPGGTRWPLFWGVLAVVVALVFLNFLINYQGRKSGEGLALSGERRGGE
jgi:MFS family permease